MNKSRREDVIEKEWIRVRTGFLNSFAADWDFCAAWEMTDSVNACRMRQIFDLSRENGTLLDLTRILIQHSDSAVMCNNIRILQSCATEWSVPVLQVLFYDTVLPTHRKVSFVPLGDRLKRIVSLGNLKFKSKPISDVRDGLITSFIYSFFQSSSALFSYRTRKQWPRRSFPIQFLGL
jgi:hypothetical protein